MLSFFSNLNFDIAQSFQAQQVDASTKASAAIWYYVFNSLQLATYIVTPLLILIALGLTVFASLRKSRGYMDKDGNSKKMSNGAFYSLIGFAILAFIVAVIFVTITKTTILNLDNVKKWTGIHSLLGDPIAALKTQAGIQ